MKNKLYFLKCLLLAIATSASLTLKFTTGGINFSYVNNGIFSSLIIGLFFLGFYDKYLKENKNNWPFLLLSAILTFFLIFGQSFDIVGSPKLVTGNSLLIIVSFVKMFSFFFMFNTVVNLLYNKIMVLHPSDNPPLKRIEKAFDKHPFLFCFLVIIICYIPYLIAYYPGIIANDSINQIKEFLGMHTRYMDSTILIDPNVTITNFNPVVHTLLLGSTFKIGHILGSNNFGLFLYSIIQVIIMSSIYSYAIMYMKKEGVSRKFLYMTLGIIALVPTFPFFALTNVKDSIFTTFVLLYILQLYDLIKNDTSIKKYVFLFLVSMLVILFRNNGIYTIWLSLPFLLIPLKKKRKAIFIVFVMVILTNSLYGKVLLPALGISSTSPREALSIPFQQTARLVKYHEEIIAEEDKIKIDKILNYANLADLYTPKQADPVKNTYNKNATREELKEYFGVWFKYLLKRPDVYVNATINNAYAYFYPDSGRRSIHYRFNSQVVGTDLDYSYINSLRPIRSVLEKFGMNYYRIPIIGMIVNIGFNIWIYLFMAAVLIVNKKREYLPVLLPAFSLMLACIASPDNGNFRYAIPFVFSLPVVLFLLYNILDKRKIKKN